MVFKRSFTREGNFFLGTQDGDFDYKLADLGAIDRALAFNKRVYDRVKHITGRIPQASDFEAHYAGAARNGSELIIGEAIARYYGGAKSRDFNSILYSSLSKKDKVKLSGAYRVLPRWEYLAMLKSSGMDSADFNYAVFMELRKAALNPAKLKGMRVISPLLDFLFNRSADDANLADFDVADYYREAADAVMRDGGAAVNVKRRHRELKERAKELRASIKAARAAGVAADSEMAAELASVLEEIAEIAVLIV